jgi:hypothetical protein
MEHIIFLESAAQSIALRDENIPPPVSINVEDLMEPQILSQREYPSINGYVHSSDADDYGSDADFR